MASHVVTFSHNLRRLVLPGPTGSISIQALEILFHLGEYTLQVVALAAGGSRLELLTRQATTWEVPVLAVIGGGENLAGCLRQALRSTVAQADRPGRITTILIDPDAAIAAVQAARPRVDDMVVNDIIGPVGLLSTLTTLISGTRLALVSREPLVVKGTLTRRALTHPSQIVPVDSEHSTIAQALACNHHEKRLTSPVLSGCSETRRLVLAASGGPSRGYSRAGLAGIGAIVVFEHPTRDMGPVMTISPSTLINRGLELIEVHLPFDATPERIDVVIHSQSVVHSIVEFTDGVTTAQTSPSDIRLLITLGSTWPECPDLSSLMTPNDWREPVNWVPESLDNVAFPAVDLARNVAAASDTYPVVLNMASEQAVAAFLTGGLEWLDIVRVGVAVVGEYEGLTGPGLDGVLAVETWARARADELITTRDGGMHSRVPP